MRRALRFLPVLLALGCQTVPETGRRQLNLFSESHEESLGVQAYREMLSQARVIDTGPEAEMVRRAGRRIAAVSHKPEFDWEFRLIDDPETVNAFCLPGGKVAFYTGILPLTQTEAGLAVVMGHEVAHAIARHGGERMSQSLGVEVVLAAADLGLAKTEEGTKNLILGALGVGGEFVVVLPFSRKQESEADEIGILYTARAGYDPREAVAFWRRMAASSGPKPPEFLSTHPSDETRIRDLERLLPRAIAEYERTRAAP